MYRQILFEPSQRYLQRIIWKETNNSPIKTYPLNTVTYGRVSAPFLVMRVLMALADAEHQDFPEAEKIISRDMYMDDIVTKIFLWVYGVNSPTRRIMENEGLFINVQKNM
ncbi:hypothetical protein AVEN_184003-1 [Araneus ventricosus]|uniref:Reverse transcriptase domain-containing protein n=1 Tax=Araneus ventricosus TaxID=182803 RepID=A0A4Y2E2P9_ARAVE|nr:hypothetical protein AVEN_184003-1 [Araneus ventricosus]